jgi:Tfp pilus assembly protein PilV
MRTFPETKPARRGRLNGPRAALRARLGDARGQDGFLLVEVMISAMLVAMIVVATFNGLDVATRLSTDQRRHDQAAILAAQSQEQLRSEPASALNALVGSPHSFTKTVGNTKYTITQEAKNIGSSGKTTGCSVTEKTANTGTNFQISSRVGWAQQAKAKRPEVKESGVVTPPTGSAIEVDVTNGRSEGVSGVTAKATFIPVESGSYNTVEGTTSTAGCVVLTGIQATKATVEIVEKTGYVTPSGALKVPNKEVTIAPNITTHYPVQYAQAGRIEARFTYKGATTWEGNEVVGDTFIAAQNGGLGVKPEYEPGATFFKYAATGEENYLPYAARALESATPSQSPYLYKTKASTASSSKYPYGDLFPFKGAWEVFAGDCSADNTGAEARPESAPVVKEGEVSTVNVPLSYTQLSIWTGTGPKEKKELTASRYGPVKITNTECESALTPPNATGTVYVHEQKETLPAGRLEEPFQPFGKNFSLCVVNGEAKKTYSVPFTNTTVAGSTPNIYLGQRPTATIKSERATQEALVKAKEPYKEKSGYVNKKKEAETEKAKYETEKANYEAALNNYKTTKAAYEKKKKEYEKSHKASQRTEYEELAAEYKAYETEYKKYETEYKKYEAAYKTDETQATEYQYYLEYVAAKAAYEKLKAEEKEGEESGVTVESGTTC